MSNRDLVEILVEEEALKTPQIIDAFLKIDRADFVPVNLISEAYGNYPLPIGSGQTISQPFTVAFVMELLKPLPGNIVLDVGSGSGWTTALLAQMVGPTGKVISMELIREVYEQGVKNISRYGFIEKGTVTMICGNAADGEKEHAPFNRIAAAAALTEIPLVWKNQLKIGGRIVAPVGSNIVALDKKSEDKFEQRDYYGFAFVPFIS